MLDIDHEEINAIAPFFARAQEMLNLVTKDIHSDNTMFRVPQESLTQVGSYKTTSAYDANL